MQYGRDCMSCRDVQIPFSPRTIGYVEPGSDHAAGDAESLRIALAAALCYQDALLLAGLFCSPDELPGREESTADMGLAAWPWKAHDELSGDVPGRVGDRTLHGGQNPEGRAYKVRTIAITVTSGVKRGKGGGAYALMRRGYEPIFCDRDEVLFQFEGDIQWNRRRRSLRAWFWPLP